MLLVMHFLWYLNTALGWLGIKDHAVCVSLRHIQGHNLSTMSLYYRNSFRRLSEPIGK